MGEEFDKVCCTTEFLYEMKPEERVKHLERENIDLVQRLEYANVQINVLTDLLTKERTAYREASIFAGNNCRERDDLYERLMSVRNILFHHDSTVRMSKEVRSTLEKIFNI